MVPDKELIDLVEEEVRELLTKQGFDGAVHTTAISFVCPQIEQVASIGFIVPPCAYVLAFQ